MKYKINDKIIGTNDEFGEILEIDTVNENYVIKWISDGYISHIPMILANRYFKTKK